MPLKETHTPHTGVESWMETKLTRIAQVAQERPQEKFTSLYHLLNEEMLKECHRELQAFKAPGIDHITKAEYAKNLEQNVTDLVGRLKRMAYRPQPARRTYIEKPGTNKLRPLGIPAYEDKLVQAGLTKILTAIYEADFMDFSYGFRPNRGQHDALRRLSYIIQDKRVNYVVDADITGFFDHVDHEWMMKFLGHRITDPNIHRIIKRILKSGYMEEGQVHDTTEGTPQGGVVSPILSNIYLHYVLDLWFGKVVKRQCRGEAYMVRFADDFVCCFQFQHEAEKFYQELQLRLEKFGLSISAEKSKIIEFGKLAQAHSAKEGNKKPDTFDFLGFTHYCATSRRGYFVVRRKTSRKKYRASLMRMKVWIRKERHLNIKELIAQLKVKLRGHYQYYGVNDNGAMLKRFKRHTEIILYKWLNRRSQRRSFTWEAFERFLERWQLPEPKITVNVRGYDLKQKPLV